MFDHPVLAALRSKLGRVTVASEILMQFTPYRYVPFKDDEVAIPHYVSRNFKYATTCGFLTPMRHGNTEYVIIDRSKLQDIIFKMAVDEVVQLGREVSLINSVANAETRNSIKKGIPTYSY